MCGINLIVDKKNRLDTRPVEHMLESTVHRGPDRQGVRSVQVQDAQVYLGVNRLMISGMSEYSNQPFQAEPHQAILAYNGALYNSAVLKSRLISKGYVFRSSSDTEILYYHLLEHGIDGVRDLNGMYAFIFVDPGHGAIYLARDTYGIKPLFYYEDDHVLIACSEIRGILATGLVDKILNEKQIGHYLSQRYAQPPETFYRNIFEVVNHSTACWSGDSLMITPFLSTGRSTDDDGKIYQPADIVSRVQSVVRDALLNVLHAEVPLGMMLSGGVDSTLLLALAHEQGVSIPSFTISGGTSTYSTQDDTFAASAARQYGSEHILIDAPDLEEDAFEAHVRALDQPIGDSSSLMTQIVCGTASDTVKILLTGAGADELFAGYNRHLAFDFYLRHRNALLNTRQLFPIIRALTPSGYPHPLRKHFRLAHKFLNSLDPDPAATFARMRGLYTTAESVAAPAPPVSGENSREAWLTYALNTDRQGYLISDVLALTDRMSMHHSLEVRPPYLDSDVSALAQSLPAEILLARGRKWILKEILRSLGGEKFASRPKEGFGLPTGEWIRNKKHAYLCAPLNNRNSILHHYADRQASEHMLQSHLQKKADYSQEIWALAVLGHWLAAEFG